MLLLWKIIPCGPQATTLIRFAGRNVFMNQWFQLSIKLFFVAGVLVSYPISDLTYWVCQTKAVAVSTSVNYFPKAQLSLNAFHDYSTFSYKTNFSIHFNVSQTIVPKTVPYRITSNSCVECSQERQEIATKLRDVLQQVAYPLLDCSRTRKLHW